MSIAEKEGNKPSSRGLLFERAVRVIREFLFWKIFWKLPALRSLVLWRFAVATRNIVALEDALKFVSNSEPSLLSRQFGALISPTQMRSEIRALCETVLQRRPRTVLEIGTAHGGTFFLFSRVAADDAFLVSVDLPTKDLKPWRSLCAYLGKKGQSVFVIDGDSHATLTVERVHRVFGDRKVDFLFIDGDHSYEGVRQDFENYVGFLNETGIVAFHDINPDYRRFGKQTRRYSGEVPRFWAEVKMTYSHAEFIDNPNQDGLGIGILFFVKGPSGAS